jgi:galactokinase
MYRIIEGSTQGLNDVTKFIDLINSPSIEISDFFDKQKDIFIARAPGRLDVMGGIADYSGSLVLEMPIAEATLAAVQKSDDQKIRIRSLARERYEDLQFEISLSEFETVDYEAARRSFSVDRPNHWASYIAGVFPILRHEHGFEFQNGARVLIASDVPPGKGVSSSAALEVATMQAVCAAFDIAIEPRRMAILCQKVENLIVGAPCGVMDQITSHCGVENSLISLLCQPAEIKEIVEIPEGIEFWGIDSGVRHAVTGSDYSSVRLGAFMGYRIIAELAGLDVENLEDGLVEIDDKRWHGYLSNISPTEYERAFSAEIPETMIGSEFIGKYGGITDRVTKIDPDKTYSVRASTEFPIYENRRASRFAELLKSKDVSEHLNLLGEMMFESHACYAACGLTESGTNRIVELVRERRCEDLFGARITGGGSGGTVAVLGTNGTSDVIAKIARQYAEEMGREPYIFSGSSPGCAAFGRLRLRSKSS